MQVDDDESFLLDGLDTSLGYGVRCDATVCNPIMFAPGPFGTHAAVGWLKNLNISLQCSANGIDWQAGNTLRVSDSVIQGYPQFGVRTGTVEVDSAEQNWRICTRKLGIAPTQKAISEKPELSRRGPRWRLRVARRRREPLPCSRIPVLRNISITCSSKHNLRCRKSSLCRTGSNEWSRKHYDNHSGNRRSDELRLITSDASRRCP